MLTDPSDSYLASSLENGPLVPLRSAQIQCQTIDVRHSLTPGCSRRQQACSSVGDDVCIATRPQLGIPSPFACPGHYHVHYSMQSSKYSSRIPHPRRLHRPAPLSCAHARHRLPLATSKCSPQLPNAALPIRFAAQGTISSHLQDPPLMSHNDDSPGPSDLSTPRCTTRVPLIHDSFILLVSFSFLSLTLSCYIILRPYCYSVLLPPPTLCTHFQLSITMYNSPTSLWPPHHVRSDCRSSR